MSIEKTFLKKLSTSMTILFSILSALTALLIE